MGFPSFTLSGQTRRPASNPPAQITDADQLKQLSALNNRSFNAAKIVVSTIPLLIIYPFLQKYFVTGMVIGAVKE